MRLFRCLMMFAIVCMPTMVVAKCEDAWLQEVDLKVFAESVEGRVTTVPTPLILDVIPDFNPETEMLWAVNGVGHSLFYTGGYRIDWHHPGQFHIRDNPKVIQSEQFVVRVYLGAEKVREIVALTQAGSYLDFNVTSCQHTELAVLHAAGITPDGGISFDGATNHRRIFFKGFADLTGKLYRQTVYMIGPEDKAKNLEYVTNFYTYLKTAADFYRATFMHHLFKSNGFTDEELAQLVSQLSAVSQNQKVALEALNDVIASKSIDGKHFGAINPLSELFFSETKTFIEAQGYSETQAIALVARKFPGMDRGQIKEITKQMLINAWNKL